MERHIVSVNSRAIIDVPGIWESALSEEHEDNFSGQIVMCEIGRRDGGDGPLYVTLSVDDLANMDAAEALAEALRETMHEVVRIAISKYETRLLSKFGAEKNQREKLN